MKTCKIRGSISRKLNIRLKLVIGSLYQAVAYHANTASNLRCEDFLSCANVCSVQKLVANTCPQFGKPPLSS
jgi:hypothetical protein